MAPTAFGTGTAVGSTWRWVGYWRDVGPRSRHYWGAPIVGAYGDRTETLDLGTPFVSLPVAACSLEWERQRWRGMREVAPRAKNFDYY